MSVEEAVRETALRAKAASRVLAGASDALRKDALFAMAAALRAGCGDILRANEIDVAAGREAAMSAGLLDRLLLTEDRIEAMAASLESLAELPDAVGRLVESRVLDNGLELKKVTVPLGVVAMVYEARPNVTADAAGICIRTGNAVVLRGGSSALNSNVAIARALSAAVASVGLPADSVCLIESTDRAAADALMRLRGVVDVLIPRGGAGLIRRCVENSHVPVIETGTGNCHVFVHRSADFDMARSIVMNAKTQRPGVCNACESLLVDCAIAGEFLPLVFGDLAGCGVTVHADDGAFGILASVCGTEGASEHLVSADEDDWGREYLSLDISVRVVSGTDEAIELIGLYGTGHSECIVADTSDAVAAADIASFVSGVDASAVYINASTRFTDGGCFGMGAEIGISTQKLHVRGPFATEALTTIKYVLAGNGQVRC